MKSIQSVTRATNIVYTFSQFSYWLVHCAVAGTFAQVFLEYRGLTNSQIGLALSLSAALAIGIQTFFSDLCDKHPHIPLKGIVAVVFAVTAALAAIMNWLPCSVIIVMVCYSSMAACSSAQNGFLNALPMQLSNLGLTVNYGIPRGLGSLGFALFSLLLGNILEEYSPDILLPVTLGLCIVAAACVLLMPRPSAIAKKHHLTFTAQTAPKTSLATMLKGNPTFCLFLIATTLIMVGQSISMSYLNPCVEAVGGSTSDTGTLAMVQSISELPCMFLSAFLLKRFTSNKLVLFSAFGFMMKILLLTIAPSVGFMYASVALGCIGMGLFAFSSVYFVNSIVRSPETVRAQALVTACMMGGLATIIGGLLGGIMLDAFGTKILLVLTTILTAMGLICMVKVNHLYQKYFKQK